MFRSMKTAVIVWVLLSAPVALFTVGWGLKLIFDAAGMVVFMLCCASIATAGLSIASLLDSRETPHSPPRADR